MVTVPMLRSPYFARAKRAPPKARRRRRAAEGAPPKARRRRRAAEGAPPKAARASRAQEKGDHNMGAMVTCTRSITYWPARSMQYSNFEEIRDRDAHRPSNGNKYNVMK